MDDNEDGFDDTDPELAEALRLSLADARPGEAANESGGSALGGGSKLGGGVRGGSGARMPNARVNHLGVIELFAPLTPSADLVLEDGSIVRAGGWRVDGGVVTVLPAPCGDGSRKRGLPDADAVVKWCSKCHATIDGTFNRNAWAFRCSTCSVDLCGACYNELPRPCAHVYQGLPPGGGMGGRGPPAPPPLGRTGGRPGRR